jgi:aminoglycoside phosphotransferase (APT) family kinase protein
MAAYTKTAVAIDPSSAEQVGQALLECVRGRLGASVAFLEAPQSISDGWETYIYAFQLSGEGLPEEWSRPLILRIYPGDRGAERASQEVAMQRFVADRGYPAPRPLLAEPDAAPLGRAFMIMERAPGRMLVDAMSGKPQRFFGLVRRMAELHVELHQVDAVGCPASSDGPLVERLLAMMRDLLAAVQLEELEGLAWLEANKGIVLGEERSVCHDDFHPLNILIDNDGHCCVIDWSGATVGDRHYDIACTLVLLRTAPFEGRNLFEKLVNGLARRLMVSRYQRRYRQLLPIDKERLRYWEAFRAFEWVLFLTALPLMGTEEAGIKGDTPSRVPDDMVKKMQRYVRQRTKG